ncbi:MAG: hypothetical protein V7695_17335 [Sulfitobacter sp.]
MSGFLKSFTFLFIVLFPLDVAAKSWSEAIADVEQRADALWEHGRSLGAPTFLGTAMNEVGAPEHTCGILGRMLGLSDQIKHLEENPEPELSKPPTEDQLFELMAFAQSLNNWAHIAESMRRESDDSKKKIWNLECVGRLGIAANAGLIVKETSAEFRVEGADLLVLGNIEANFSDRLEAVLQQNPQIERLVLGSGGGSVVEALKAGLVVRKRGLSTTLRSNCFSACPLVFLGGQKRTIWSPYPVLGFHRMSDGSGRAIHPSHPLYEVIFTYVESMGADPNFFLASMLRADPIEMYEPDHADLCRYFVATWVQRLCFGGENQ